MSGGLNITLKSFASMGHIRMVNDSVWEGRSGDLILVKADSGMLLIHACSLVYGVCMVYMLVMAHVYFSTTLQRDF